MAMRNASTGQFFARALFLAAGLVTGLPLLASAQGAPVPDTHTVRKGDTLWDLAKTYFGDPLTWPQIYKLNTSVIEDPHWIYPGEVLQLSGTGGGVIPAEPAAPAPVAMAAVPAPAPVALAPGLEVVPPSPAAAVEPEVYADAPAGGQGGGVRAAGPIPGDPTALFGKTNAEMRTEQMLIAYGEKAYRPLRPGEFYSAGFLTENQRLPFGEVRGNVVPAQISTIQATTTASQFGRIGITPPKGGAYQVGDSLLIAERVTSAAGFGDMIVPTGIGQVVELSETQATAIILSQFKRIRIGQVTLPLERFTPGGTARAIPVSDGIEAAVVQTRTGNVLTSQQNILFLNKGRADGVAPGDVFELWSTPEQRYDASTTVAEPMARVQVVRVGEHTSSALVVRVSSADIRPGTRARQVAKLPT